MVGTEYNSIRPEPGLYGGSAAVRETVDRRYDEQSRADLDLSYRDIVGRKPDQLEQYGWCCSHRDRDDHNCPETPQKESTGSTRVRRGGASAHLEH